MWCFAHIVSPSISRPGQRQGRKACAVGQVALDRGKEGRLVQLDKLPWTEAYELPWTEACKLPWTEAYKLPWTEAYTLPWTEAYTLPWTEAYTLPWTEAYTSPWTEAYKLPWTGAWKKSLCSWTSQLHWIELVIAVYCISSGLQIFEGSSCS